MVFLDKAFYRNMSVYQNYYIFNLSSQRKFEIMYGERDEYK